MDYQYTNLLAYLFSLKLIYLFGDTLFLEYIYPLKVYVLSDKLNYISFSAEWQIVTSLYIT